MNRFLCALVLCVTPFLVAADKVEEKAAAGNRAQLLGKWIVRSVQRDGKPTPAQIGREVGDVITFKKTGHQFEIS
jgi:hypothetical protein